MAYCAVGAITLAEKETVTELCQQVQIAVENKIRQLDTNNIEVIKNRLSELIQDINSLNLRLEMQNNRVKDLENNCANSEITTNEVIEMYGGTL